MIYVISVKKKKTEILKNNASPLPRLQEISEALSTYICFSKTLPLLVIARNTVFYFVDPIGDGSLWGFFWCFFLRMIMLIEPLR